MNSYEKVMGHSVLELGGGHIGCFYFCARAHVQVHSEGHK